MKKIAYILIILAIAAGVTATTKQDAIEAINASHSYIDEMKTAGFGVNFVNDLLGEAQNALQRAEFAELLRTNATGELAEEAKVVLEGINYEGFGYEEVIKFTGQIEERKEKSYIFSDQIRALELKAEQYKKEGVTIGDIDDKIIALKGTFQNERYGEVEEGISKINLELEDHRAEQAKLKAVIRSGKGFLEKNFIGVFITVIVVIAVVIISMIQYKKRYLRKELERLKREKINLENLMKKVQKDRFENKTMSKSLYEVMMSKYKKKLNEVERNIPVIKHKLKYVDRK